MTSRQSQLRPIRLEFICVGTELLTGKVNTHTAYLGPKLSEVGLGITREHAVGDDPTLMRETFTEVFKRADVVICAGGLGPTFDDITREVWSLVLHRKLRKQPWLVIDIRKKFKSRGLVMPPMNHRQALVLSGADVIPNAFGTAPGQIIRLKGKTVVLLPGPGRELFPMVESTVLPRLRDLFPGRFSVQKSLLIYGLPESQIDAMVRPWVARRSKFSGCQVTHGILASQAIITVKFMAEGTVRLQVEAAAEQLKKELTKILGHLVFGENTDTLESVVGRLLTLKNKTLAVAESCTGGLIAKLLTDMAGSSHYFLEGITTYSNKSKRRRLGVKAATLARYGAVSSPVAKEMAEGIKKSSGVDFALSVTGIAGPNGGTEKKPVGLVFIGVAGPRGTKIVQYKFKGERSYIRQRAALSALNLLRISLLSK